MDLFAVLDALTGKLLGGLEVPLDKDDIFSPDGKMLASVFPAQTWTFESGRIEERPGGVAVWDMESGEQLSLVWLEDNRGLFPPWGSGESHLLHVDNKGVLRAYDRASGELPAEHDTSELAAC